MLGDRLLFAIILFAALHGLHIIVELVFDAFHRLQPKDRGTGLGLNLVQEIVRYHGGEITIADSASGGACFRITLPYC